MLNILNNLNNIIQFQTEIYSVLALAGALLFVHYTKRTRNLLWCGMLIIVVFGYSWRLFFLFRMSSSRYCSALIYPTVMLCGFIMAYCWRNRIGIFKLTFPGKLLLWAAVLAIAVYSAAKLSRMRPKSFERGVEIIRRDCGSASGMILCTKEGERIGYYSGMETRQIPKHVLSQPAPRIVREFKRALNRYRYCADRLYIAAILPKKNPDVIRRINDDPALEIIADIGFLKKTSQRMLIISERRGAGKRIYRKEPIRNGDFSRTLPRGQNRQRKDALVKKGIAFFYDDNVSLPTDWSIYSKDPRAQVYLECANGNAVLIMRAESSVALLYEGKLRFSADLNGISFTARGERGTDAVLKVWKIDEKNVPDEHLPVAEIRLTPADKVYNVSLTDCGLLPGEGFSFEIIVRNGTAAVDDFSLLYDDPGLSPQSGAAARTEGRPE